MSKYDEYVDDELNRLEDQYGWVRVVVFFICSATLLYIFSFPVLPILDSGVREIGSFTIGLIAAYIYSLVGED